jgi:hypothetical protein
LGVALGFLVGGFAGLHAPGTGNRRPRAGSIALVARLTLLGATG